MATRLYLPSSGAVDIAPAFAAFTETDLMDRVEMSVHKKGTAMTNKTTAQTATAGNSSQGIRQYISPPLAAQFIASQNITASIRCLESAANDNVDAIRYSLRFWDVSAGAFGGTSLRVLGNGTVAEFNTALRSKNIPSTATTAVTVDNGDRLVLDLAYTNTLAGTSISATMNFGDDSATDLALNETDTAANNPWVELSGDIIWFRPDRPDIFPLQPVLAQ